MTFGFDNSKLRVNIAVTDGPIFLRIGDNTLHRVQGYYIGKNFGFNVYDRCEMIIQKLETLVKKPFDEWGGWEIVLTDIEVFYQKYENNVEEITPGTIYFDGKAIPCAGLIRNHMLYFGNSRLRNDSLSGNKLIEVYFGTMAPQKLPLDVTRQGAEIMDRIFRH